MSDGKIIGGLYEMGAVLGQGGMGTVYWGRHIQTGEKVAIKSLNRDILILNPELLERFNREAEALRRLNHPNIVKTFGTVVEDDENYIIMEYVGGGSLRDLMIEQPQMPIDRILDITLDLSDALTRAHRLSIIHRDLKPANVMLAEDGTPRLTDFGVARIGDTTQMTQTGAVVGTPAYLSPEALMGEKLDARADIWAFGVMIYEMITSVRPFDEDNTGALLLAIMQRPAPDIMHYRHDVPFPLIGLVYWMLEKDREKRIASTRLVGAQLEAIITGSDKSLQAFIEPGTPSNIERPSTPPTPTNYRMHTPIPGSINVSQFLDDVPTTFTPPPPTEPPTSLPAPVIPPPIVTTTPVPVAKTPNRMGIAVVGILILVIAGLVFALVGRPPTDSAPTPTTLAAVSGTTDVPADISLEACPPRTVRVLIAQFEHLGGTERDVQRFIVQDVTQKFGDVPFANICVRAYPAQVANREIAIATAQKHNALLVIAGNYDENGLNPQVYLGDYSAYGELKFPREEIEKLVNVRLEMTNERTQSLAYTIVAELNGIYTFVPDGYAIARNVAVVELLEPSDVVAPGNSMAARFHRFFINYVNNPEQSLEEMNQAIALEPKAYLFNARGLLYQRLGNLEKSREDIRSAQRLAPEGWAGAAYMLGNDAVYFRQDYVASIGYYTEVIDNTPENWFNYTVRGISYYFNGDYANAQSDIDKAIALEPEANFPYLFAIVLSLRDGRVKDTLELVNTVTEKFPDPSFGTRLIRVTMNEEAAQGLFPSAMSAFGNMLLFQWSRVVEDVNQALESNVELPELYFMRGFAYCNLEQYAEAESDYTRALELDPSLIAIYGLRADVRREQGNLIGLAQDGQAVAGSPFAEQFAPVAAQIATGQITCQNFFTIDPALLGGE